MSPLKIEKPEEKRRGAERVEPPENTKLEKKPVERPISGGNHLFQ